MVAAIGRLPFMATVDVCPAVLHVIAEDDGEGGGRQMEVVGTRADPGVQATTMYSRDVCRVCTMLRSRSQRKRCSKPASMWSAADVTWQIYRSATDSRYVVEFPVDLLQVQALLTQPSSRSPTEYKACMIGVRTRNKHRCCLRRRANK